MVDPESNKIASPSTTATDMSLKKDYLSSSMKRTSEWIYSQEVTSDLTITAGGISFSLHKFPLVSKSGYISKLVSESNQTDLSVIEIPDIPGGSEAFELAAKFCYGINFEIGTSNIAMLRCAAEYLEMTEDYAIGNLVGRAEAYLNEVALKSLAGAVSVLHSSENFLPIAEIVKLVSRCIDAIAYIVCKDTQNSSSPSDIDRTFSYQKPTVDWWAEDLIVLRIDIFQRVLIAMLARGFKQYTLGPILMLYAQNSLRGLETFGKGRKNIDSKQEHEKRVILETIVSLLPREKNAMSVSFLSTLLRAAIYLETTVACRLDLEKRMGSQLGQAVLDDLLIPSYSFSGDTLFDVDTVQRVMMNYMEIEMAGDRFSRNVEVLPPVNDMEKVGRLMENYLAEIASDRNLTVAKFISLSELIPEHTRVTEDAMYRAIDIYLKAHPVLSDMEKKKVCSVMDCQKLTREACAHAAQNDRLPVQTVVQVLYYEQQRLRDVMNGSGTGNTGGGDSSPVIPMKVKQPSMDITPVSNELSSLKRENQDLKLELLKMKMRLKEMEKPGDKSVTESPRRITNPSADKPPLPRKSFMSSVSKKLGKLYPFVGGIPLNAKARNKPSKDRRHSIS